jgi:hypothetical protein
MDLNVLAVIIAIFALVVVAAFIVYRQRGKVAISGPLGTGLKLDASNEPPPPTPGVEVEGARSKGGGLLAEDRTGRGARVKDVAVQDDILVSSTPPPGDASPKA